MIEKWKKWVLKMNLKRAALIFVVSSVVLILVLLAAMHGVFEREMFCWESVIVFLTICGIIGTILAIWYWILCLNCVYRKSSHLGTNNTLWILATVFFHIVAVAALYAYAAIMGTCENCGKIKYGEEKYCDRCGAALKKICPHCEQILDTDADYCSNCGTSLKENKEETKEEHKEESVDS